jgi:hypothetical protein
MWIWKIIYLTMVQFSWQDNVNQRQFREEYQMKRRINYFLTILLAIILSSPLSLTIILLSDYFSDPQAYSENYAYNKGFYL